MTSETNEVADHECKRCGRCCVANGLIPPLVPGSDRQAPPWLQTLVANLRRHFAQVAEDYSCVFLTEKLECAIHGLPTRPTVCSEFFCKPVAA